MDRELLRGSAGLDRLVVVCFLMALTTSCSLLSDGDQPASDLAGLSHDAVTETWGEPDVVRYQDGKLLEVATPPIDFAANRVAYDFTSRNRRVWFKNGVVETVIVLGFSKEAPDVTATDIGDPPR